MGARIRLARIEEESVCSRILANAFLWTWNHNWFQGIKSSVPKLPYSADPHSTQPRLSALQERRRKFYHALIRLTRLSGGSVNVVTQDSEILAILLWHPPYKLPTLYHILSAGFIRLALLDYGLRSLWRVQFVFEHNVNHMFKEAHIDTSKYGFVQMLAVNPDHAGHGYGAELLNDMLRRHTLEYPDSPGVLLDCTMPNPEKMYAKQGFHVIGQVSVNTGTDKDGLRLSTRDERFAQKKAEGLKAHIQKVMIWKP